MLNLWGSTTRRDCSGLGRRDFLKVGTLGITGLTLPGLLKLRSAAAGAGQPTRDTSVIWLWLGGADARAGPAHRRAVSPDGSHGRQDGVRALVRARQFGPYRRHALRHDRR